MSREQDLIAKVNAVNAANKKAAELHPLFVDAFRPFVGQKIEKVGGGFLLKVEKAVPKVDAFGAFQFYRYYSNYNLVWIVKICQMAGEHSCVYHETSFYVGEMKDGVLTKLMDYSPDRTDYTVEEIQNKQKALRDAKDVLDNARSALGPFPEY